MNTNNRYCVIMADGSGSPYQLRITFDRFLKVVPQDHILVVTPARFAGEARKVLPELLPENLLQEPMARKTAPCMAYAAYTLLSRNHVLMTLGIVPKTPDVNFGYIQVREGRNAHLMAGPLQVKTFTEKPSPELADVFVRTGEFFWNSGIFVWKAATIVSEMEKYIPEVTEMFKGWETRIGDPVFVEQAYVECPKVSLDYGVMERTSRAWLYPARFGWADIDRL